MSLPREWSLQDARGSMYRSSGPAGTLSKFSSEADDPFQCIEQHSPCSKPVSEFNLSQTEQTAVATDIALFAEYNTAGSLFSVHSAPPLPHTDTVSGVQSNGSIYGGNGAESPLRPVSLAIDSQQNFSTKTIAAFPIPSSEIDEEDNENLLTVSSVTARPLIAKSREIRNNKFAERFKRRQYLTNDTNQQPLDGGYGWFVVFGAFSVQFWVAGLVKSYGVLFVEILETFPSSSTAVASWIPAILSALCLALAPVSSALCQRFSCRLVVFIGGIFCALGLTLSYFATSLYHLLFTFGILTGIGGGLSTTPGIIIVSLYFTKRRALANGICVSGTAAGSFVFPMLIEFLIKKFGFHGTILILGGCMIHVCASALLYRPLDNNNSTDIKSPKTELSSIGTASNSLANKDASQYIERLFMEETKNRLNDFYNTNKLANVGEKVQIENDDEEKDIVGETRFLKPSKSIRSSTLLHSVEDLSTDSTCVYKAKSGYDSNRSSRYRNSSFKAKDPPMQSNNRGLSKSMIIPSPVSDFSEFGESTDKHPKETCCDKITRYIDVSLLREPMFVGMVLSVVLMSTGCPYMLYFLPAYVLSAGYTKSEAGFLVALSASLDLIGRLGLGYLSDLQIFDRKKAYTVCILGAGTAVLLIPSANSWYLIGCSSAAYGLCLGCWYLLMPVLLADLFGTERISSSYGLVRMFQSVGAISVPPLAGFLKDLTGGYEICFYCMGACMVLGSLPLLILSIMNKEHDNSTTEESDVSTVSN